MHKFRDDFCGGHYLSCFSLANEYIQTRSYSNMDKVQLYAELTETETRFKRACEQVVLLNDKLEGLQRRYDKARQENHRSFRYNLRLKMASVEGVRNAYYEYACEKAERIAELRYYVSEEAQSDSDGEDSMVY